MVRRWGSCAVLVGADVAEGAAVPVAVCRAGAAFIVRGRAAGSVAGVNGGAVWEQVGVEVVDIAVHDAGRDVALAVCRAGRGHGLEAVDDGMVNGKRIVGQAVPDEAGRVAPALKFGVALENIIAQQHRL